MILRNAENRDIPVLKELFTNWIAREPDVLKLLEDACEPVESETSPDCRVLQRDGSIIAAILSVHEGTDRRRIVAFGTTLGWGDRWLKRFLEQQIMDWAARGMSRAGFRIPATADPALLELLHETGFFSEGVSTSLHPTKPAHVHHCKHFIYQTVDEENLLEFLKDVLQRLGYETKDEDNAFSFRPAPTLLLPFLFGSWHRISRIGRDIILQPPVRRVELHELETVFYPLSIRGVTEKPLLLIMNAKNASRLIDLPQHDLEQGNLFPGTTLCRPRNIHLSDITCTHPSAARLVRKGLPLLFYVHRIGAVGSARVDDWELDEPAGLCNKFRQSQEWDAAEMVDHCATSGPLTGKVLAVRFHWFIPFKRAVSFERMRMMDESFHPQRTRTISPELFRNVVEVGGAPQEV